MRIGVIGLGRVGSAVANNLLFNPKISEIWVYDTDKNVMEGEAVDLNHASYILNGRCRIRKARGLVQMQRRCKLLIICAGRARRRAESDGELYRRNKHIVRDITDRIGTGHLIVTNPVEMLAEEFGHKPMGLLLDKIREDTDGIVGEYILRLKGHTNWGIAAEVFKELERLCVKSRRSV